MSLISLEQKQVLKRIESMIKQLSCSQQNDESDDDQIRQQFQADKYQQNNTKNNLNITEQNLFEPPKKQPFSRQKKQNDPKLSKDKKKSCQEKKCAKENGLNKQIKKRVKIVKNQQSIIDGKQSEHKSACINEKQFEQKCVEVDNGMQIEQKGVEVDNGMQIEQKGVEVDNKIQLEQKCVEVDNKIQLEQKCVEVDNKIQLEQKCVEVDNEIKFKQKCVEVVNGMQIEQKGVEVVNKMQFEQKCVQSDGINEKQHQEKCVQVKIDDQVNKQQNLFSINNQDNNMNLGLNLNEKLQLQQVALIMKEQMINQVNSQSTITIKFNNYQQALLTQKVIYKASILTKKQKNKINNNQLNQI